MLPLLPSGGSHEGVPPPHSPQPRAGEGGAQRELQLGTLSSRGRESGSAALQLDVAHVSAFIVDVKGLFHMTWELVKRYVKPGTLICFTVNAPIMT